MMMVLNVVFLKLLISAMGHMPSDVGVLPWMLLIVGIARVARKADSIVARMGLNPAIILLSLSVWGTLLGFIGLIIALPLTTLLLSYYDRYITSRENRELYREITTDEDV